MQILKVIHTIDIIFPDHDGKNHTSVLKQYLL
jgi:hypothetical protein